MTCPRTWIPQLCSSLGFYNYDPFVHIESLYYPCERIEVADAQIDKKILL